MKATELLAKQHKIVKGLLETLPDATTDERRAQFEEVAGALAAHDAIERQIFYPAIEKELGMDPILGESIVEHGVIEFMLYRTDRALNGPEFSYEATVLKEAVLHHAEEEERDLFPKVKEAFDDEQLEALGKQMELLFDKQLKGDFRETVTAQLQGVLDGGMKAKPRRPSSRAGAHANSKARSRAHS
ncbi:MAG TPA: hemerythrin domain-containing protein [Polyangiaceae bacterium]|jgi:hypothetical protein|nr:hemerythrin domain-containing protein [Polyangiaceae bacterium]